MWLFQSSSEMVGTPFSRSSCGTKEMMKPCLIYLHLISLVAHPREEQEAEEEEEQDEQE